MPELIRVKMSDIEYGATPDVLVTLGLGSCVGVCVYDPLLRIGGMAHIMLPDSQLAYGVVKRGKYADTAIPDLVEGLSEKGALKTRMIVKIAGGAQMFTMFGQEDKIQIGPRNVVAVERTIAELGLRLNGRDVGGHSGRTVYFDLSTGVMTVKTLQVEVNL